MVEDSGFIGEAHQIDVVREQFFGLAAVSVVERVEEVESTTIRRSVRTAAAASKFSWFAGYSLLGCIAYLTIKSALTS